MPIELRISGNSVKELCEEVDAWLQENAGFGTTSTSSPENTIASNDLVKEEIIISNHKEKVTVPSKTDFRMRGKAGDGRIRRTKEEVAEDTKLENMAKAAGVPLEKVDSVLAEKKDRSLVLAHLQEIISKPGTVDPVVDETSQDDDEDIGLGIETAEEVTIIQIRDRLTEYSKKHGMAAAAALLRDKIGYTNLSAVEKAGPSVYADVLEAINQEF